MTERELPRGVRSADDLASLIAAYSERVRQRIARYLRDDPDAADDISQEVWLRVAAHVAQVRSASSFWPWLARVCDHLCIDHLRREASRRRSEVRLSPNTLQAVGAVAPGSTPASSRSVADPDAVLDQLVTLRPRKRAIAVAHFLLGHRPAAVATEFGLTPQTVWKELSQIRSILRESLPRLNRQTPP
jgi:RNA polymerase sigma factor (sigma-70 family)